MGKTRDSQLRGADTREKKHLQEPEGERKHKEGNRPVIRKLLEAQCGQLKVKTPGEPVSVGGGTLS